MPDVLTFQQWFNALIQRPRPYTKTQILHEALKVPDWAEADTAEMLREWLQRRILRAMKKLRADGMPVAGFGAERGRDGSRFIKRPETWTFPDWQFNILLRMKGTKRDFRKLGAIYDFGVATWGEQAQHWPRPDENPHFYWNLPDLDDLEP